MGLDIYTVTTSADLTLLPEPSIIISWTTPNPLKGIEGRCVHYSRGRHALRRLIPGRVMRVTPAFVDLTRVKRVPWIAEERRVWRTLLDDGQPTWLVVWE